jgi:NAD(P)H-flavin reductase
VAHVDDATGTLTFHVKAVGTFTKGLAKIKPDENVGLFLGPYGTCR